MPADGISAAHSTPTATSANPVSKSSFERRLHEPMFLQKRHRARFSAPRYPSNRLHENNQRIGLRF